MRRSESFIKLMKRAVSPRTTAGILAASVLSGAVLPAAFLSTPIRAFAQESVSAEDDSAESNETEIDGSDNGGEGADSGDSGSDESDHADTGDGDDGSGQDSEEQPDSGDTGGDGNSGEHAGDETADEGDTSGNVNGEPAGDASEYASSAAGSDENGSIAGTEAEQGEVLIESEEDDYRGEYVDSAYSSSGGTGYWKNFSAADPDPETALHTLKTLIDEEYFSSWEDGQRWSAYWIILTQQDRAAGLNSGRKMKAGGLIDLFIMGAVYSKAASGAEEEFALPEDVYDLVYQMIVESDTDAADRLVTEFLGEGSFSRGMLMVNRFLEENHFGGTSLGRLPGDTDSRRDNYTTAYDCAKILRSVYEGKLVNESASEAMLELLKLQDSENAIAEGIDGYNAGSVVTAAMCVETGDEQEGYSMGACSVISADRNDYILVVMADYEEGEREQAASGITDLSRETYKAVGTQSRFLPVGDKSRWDAGTDVDLPYDISTKRDEEFVRAMLEYACYWDGCIPYASSQNKTDPDDMRYDRLRKGGRTDCSWFVYHVLHKFGLLDDFVHSYEWGNNPGCYPGAYNIGSDISNASPGDILCVGDGTAPQNSHVAIYIGNGMQVECGGRDGVKVSAAPSHVRQIVHFDCLPG